MLQEIIADPDVLDQIPDDAALVLLPYDDDALSLHNLAMAGALVSQGTTAYFRRIGGPIDAGDAEPWASPAGRLPRWSEMPDKHSLSLIYNPDEATLTVDFSTGQRPTTRLFIGERTALLTDRETSEIAGYVLPMVLVERLVGRVGSGLRSSGRSPEAVGGAAGAGSGDESETAGGYATNTSDAYALFAEDLAGVAA
ncbi:MAG: hypothetical protein M3Q10_08835 [Chloroflexota bacterium]|nr:hypothetical protein [Chloroflexota bacterium]